MISVATPPARRVALMATRGTVSAGIYHERLAGMVEDLVIPAEPVQQLIDRTIAAVKGNNLALAHQFCSEAANRLVENGADRLLLACTELPMAIERGPLGSRSIRCNSGPCSRLR